MPYLRFKGFSNVFLEELTPRIVDEFAKVVQVPKEIVKIELLPYQIITNTPLSVEILMFERPQEIHDAVADSIHRLLLEKGYPNVHIFFVILQRKLYYKEGKPLE
ncbi:hypothetical protein JCM10914A_42760 [Paenibacillus sp. JCM 10914]|uniref:DUF1904 family protein n=1 Tax=Paenibacillus sp. JCM 10914 TaxID=1236974 RepID=UPI0003CCA075|nr:DUF1904 family protein [Paenibacillus sp. JCM 10914]GAE05494.1 hypothetical protein JCM10914_1597 [Paenibacillus sp. JCM 10914]